MNYDPQKLQAIIDECNAHNRDTGAGDRPPERVVQDARNIYLLRHCGITVETMAMMLTDYMFAARRSAEPISKSYSELCDLLSSNRISRKLRYGELDIARNWRAGKITDDQLISALRSPSRLPEPPENVLVKESDDTPRKKTNG